MKIKIDFKFIVKQRDITSMSEDPRASCQFHEKTR